ncbi:MAG: transketolase [Rhodobacteraceae bacterium]|nr:transketolase [Paracoccaceae bacterium]
MAQNTRDWSVLTRAKEFRPSDDVVAQLKDRAQFSRLETIRLIEIAKVGHYTSAFSAAELFAVLYYDTMNLRRGESAWSERDRFMMGKGHAACGLFPILADLDFFSKDILDGYTRLGNPLGDHPDMTKVPGIDFSSGSIGHALSAGAGMALSAKMLGSDFTTYAMIGDGELQEGQVWEAALFAADKNLGNLVGIIDRNGYQLDGAVDDVIGVEPIIEKWEAFGWDVYVVDGHDVADLATLFRALKAEKGRTKPVMVLAQTVKGKGVSYMETEPGWQHLGYLDPGDAERAIKEIKAMAI